MMELVKDKGTERLSEEWQVQVKTIKQFVNR
jgi:hypothetical protein